MKILWASFLNWFALTTLRIEQWHFERGQAKRLHYIVHKLKSEWIFSSTVRNEQGVIQDAGYVRTPTRMNRAQAMRYFRRELPRGNIIHIDDKNKIITYSF